MGPLSGPPRLFPAAGAENDRTLSVIALRRVSGGPGVGGVGCTAAPLIRHLRKRAPAVCEITLLAGDGFCSFTPDNDSDYAGVRGEAASAT